MRFMRRLDGVLDAREREGEREETAWLRVEVSE